MYTFGSGTIGTMLVVESRASTARFCTPLPTIDAADCGYAALRARAACGSRTGGGSAARWRLRCSRRPAKGGGSSFSILTTAKPYLRKLSITSRANGIHFSSKYFANASVSLTLLPPRFTHTPEPNICPKRMARHARIDGLVS